MTRWTDGSCWTRGLIGFRKRRPEEQARRRRRQRRQRREQR
nr:MAG TPA: hypothetical protein [Caudoviricetes sp.]